MERNGIHTRSGTKVEPYNPIAIFSNVYYHTSYITTIRNLLETLCRSETISDIWKYIFVTDYKMHEVVFNGATNNLLVSKYVSHFRIQKFFQIEMQGTTSSELFLLPLFI